MNETNNKIRQALRTDDAEYDLRREEGLRDMMVGAFRGKSRWLSVIAWVEMLLFSAVAVIAAIRFFQVAEVRDMILYAAAFLACLIVACLIKMWFWMLMNRNAVNREVKRLELRLAKLIEKMDQS